MSIFKRVGVSCAVVAICAASVAVASADTTTVVQPPPVPVPTVLVPPPMTITLPPPVTVTAPPETITLPPPPPVTTTVTAPPVTTTVTAPPVTTTVTTTVTAPPMNLLFNGDYATANFCQWSLLQARNYNGSACSYAPTYSAGVVSDAVKGNAGRFEVRNGDVPPFGGGERSEVSAGSSSTTTMGTEGQIRWYEFSTKFDVNFPMNHKDLGWGTTNQWHAPSDCCSPPVEWGPSNSANGQWSLVLNRQSAPGVFLSSPEVFITPLDRGNWHNIKMEIKWSTSDTVGYVRVWQNGVPQTLTNGSTTYFGRTLTPGDANGGYYKEGYYRKAGIPATGIIYHAGFHVATTEAGLG